MTLRVADRLNAARQRRFVGRAQEMAFFQSALDMEEWPVAVLHVFGPGGVGKTTLLAEFATLCRQRGVQVFTIDARTVESGPDGFIAALQRALGLAPHEPPVPKLIANAVRFAMLIDTYELLAPLDSWLRTVFLPELPSYGLVVLAGREMPALPWRTDPGWQSLVHTLPLRNLSVDESRTYLDTRAVPADQFDEVLQFAHGHPLALSLVADAFDQRPNARFHPEDAPDMIKTLLEQFIQKVPSPAHRAALEVCVLVRLTTEALLAELLDTTEAHALFDWLRDLSFIESGRLGLFPHDLAREALIADLRWRNPDWYAELHRRARAYYNARLRQANGQEQRILVDHMYLYRANPVMRQFIEWQGSSSPFATAGHERDWPVLTQLVARCEGDDSARLAEYWLPRQPTSLLIVYDGAQFDASSSEPLGFLMQIALHETSPEERRADPALNAAWEYLQQTTPLRSGERATYFRFWMARDTYQAISPTQSVMLIAMVRHYLMTPGLACTFFPCADPAFWAPLCAYAGIQRIPAADFTVGGKTYGVYSHDCRTLPPVAWLTMMAERAAAFEDTRAHPPAATPTLIVLSKQDFAAAVRNALHDFARSDVLRDNPLVRSRLVIERVGSGAMPAERVAALQELLKSTCESLQATPRDAKLYRALHVGLLQRAITQEQASEMLDLPFSTFRRHLKSGVDRVTEMLWQAELEG